METTRSVPKNMQYILRSLGQFQTQRVQLSLSSNTTVTSGSGAPIIVRLPTTGFIDLHSLAFHFKGTTAVDNNDKSTVVFPPYTSSLIRRLDVLVGGAQADSITDYNRLFHALLPVHGGDSYNNAQNPFGWSTIHTRPTGTAKAAVAGIVDANLPGVIDHFLGFLSGNPRIIDASLFPPIEVRLTVCDGNVLWPGASSAGAYTATEVVAPVNPRFTLSDMYFTIQSYRFQDDMISSIFYNQLAQGVTLPFTWKTWTGSAAYMGTSGQGAMKTTLSNASASKILTVFADNNVVASNNVDGKLYTMFYHGSDGLDLKWQYDINGNYQTPTYQTPVADTWLNTLYAFNDQGNVHAPIAKFADAAFVRGAAGSGEPTLGEFYKRWFTMTVPLNMPCAGENYQSGLDTRGTASVVVLRYSGGAGALDKTAFTWVESEARMDIGAGRQSLIQL